MQFKPTIEAMETKILCDGEGPFPEETGAPFGGFLETGSGVVPNDVSGVNVDLVLSGVTIPNDQVSVNYDALLRVLADNHGPTLVDYSDPFA